MSFLDCEHCGRFVDTDEDVDGIWSKSGYTCEVCSEELREGEEPVIGDIPKEQT